MTGKHIVAQVTANIEIDVDELIATTARHYDIPISEVTMDLIFELVSNTITYLKPARGYRNDCIREVADGPSINGFEENTYDKIADRLEELQNSIS